MFERHVDLFALDNGDFLTALSGVDCSLYELTRTSPNELNLKKGDDFLYSSQGAIAEAKEWFSQLDLDGIDVLYVYGIGLGYYYEAAAEWLNQNKQRSLIFFEDDLAVIHRFLETDYAEAVLKDSQVRVLYFRDMDLDWKVFYWTIWDHLFEGGRITALQSYTHFKKDQLELLSRRFAYEIADKRNRILEDLEYGALLFNNYYRNLLTLPQAYLGRKLFGKFSKIPAIICGAGPSLQQHLAILPRFEDYAVIFGVGSSMNILNAQGFLPHFGATMDPNPEQLQRLMMNQAYEVPFFYNNRAMHEGVGFLQGPKLFMPGSGAYETADWFEDKLHIPNRPIIQDGYSVVNFAISTAVEMGCDPIILVGMDLSDKGGRHYSQGIENHPLYKSPKSEGDSGLGEVHMEDIYGDLVSTNWLNLAEANWISFFAYQHPDVSIINASEGGIGMHNIPNVPLREVSERFFNRRCDMRGLVHESIQQAEMPDQVTDEAVVGLLKEFQQSLERCAEAYQEHAPAALIEREPGYQYLLKDFEESYLRYLHKSVGQAERLVKQKEETEANRIKHRVEQQKTSFLCDVAKAHCIYIKNTLDEASISRTNKPATSPINRKHSEQKLSRSTFVNGLRQGDASYFYSSGAIYGKLHFKDNRFEGSQIYYYPDGRVKTELEYRDGLLNGVVKLYYPNGQSKMELSFKNGMRHGSEKQWYGNGQLFIEVNYEQGKPTGSAYCWKADGTLAREVI